MFILYLRDIKSDTRREIQYPHAPRCIILYLTTIQMYIADHILFISLI